MNPSRIVFPLFLLLAETLFFAAPPRLSAQSSEQKSPAERRSPEEIKAREAWRVAITRRPLPKNGCFETSYPSTEWKETPCLPPPPYPNRPQNRGGKGGPNTVGAGNGDFDAVSSGLISSAVGSFVSVNGATSVSGDVGGVAPLKSDAFMLQINTNFFPTSVCAGVSGCQGWQQFLYSQTQCGTVPCVYMEYWLLGFGATCPAGSWQHPPGDATDCYFNGPAKGLPAQTVADLPGMKLTATTTSGGQDNAVMTTDSGSATAVGQDSVVDLNAHWNVAEFNVFGDCCSVETFFSNPTTLVLKTSIVDGTTNPPACGTNSFTAETNNLNLVSIPPNGCCPYGGSTPSIEFMETNAGHTATCGPTALIGDPHLTTPDGAHYDFQSAGEFVSLRSTSGAEIQTRQAPVSTTFIGTDGYDGLTTCVSLNTAVAARVGAHRVTYEPNLSGVPDPSGLELRIDGALTSLGPWGIDLGDGGRVIQAPFTGALQIDFPDGKTLFVTPEWWTSQSKWYLDVDVIHLGLLAAGGTSTLGIAAPLAEGSWLPALPSGASLGAMPPSISDRYVALYRKFADAWRVSGKDSLFDYAPGTSTETFTMKEWPSQRAPCVVPRTKPVEPASIDVAEAACRRVLDKARRADCVFDVRATGDPDFAKGYLATQRILTDSTTVSVAEDSDASRVGEWVNFTAYVVANAATPSGAPSGTVQFALDGSNIGAPVPVDAKGRARWETSQLRVGKHRIAATYAPGPDTSFLPSNSAEKLHVVTRCRCDDDRKY
jgi:hypothetical protein